MKTVKAFKVKIKDNFLRQLIFSDWILTSGLSVITALLIIFKTPLPNEAKIMLVTVSTTIYMVLGLGKIENQPIYKIIYKFFIYLFLSPKKVFSHTKYHDMTQNTKKNKSLIEFKIIDNFIIFPERIVSILKINPLDYSLMKQSDQDRLYLKLKDLLHTYKDDSLELITRIRESEPDDYQEYLNHLVKMPIYTPNPEIGKIRSVALEKFLINFTAKINNSTFPVHQHYLVVSHLCKSSDEKFLLDSSVILEEKSRHAAKLLTEAGFKVGVLTDIYNQQELSKTMTSLVRQIFY